MKLQGYISEVGQLQSGVSQNTGKEWNCRTLSLLVPFYTDKGEEKFDNIAADYFGELSEQELQYMIQNKSFLNFTVAFTTRTYNGRRYNTARVWNLSAVL